MLTDTDTRFSLLEMDSPSMLPAQPAPATPGVRMPLPQPARLQSVDRLYKGAFAPHATLAEAINSIPELMAPVAKVPMYTAEGITVPGAYATIRTLPDGSQQAIGVVGERYRVVQDSRALDVLAPIADKLSNFTAGVWKGQSWVYGDASGMSADIVPGDTIQARVLIGNSHDSSLAWSIGFPGNRVVCQNTFHHALSSKLSRLLKVRHTTNVNETVDQVQAAIAAFGFEFVNTADKFRYLASVKCSDEKLEELTDYVFRPSKWADDESDEVSDSSRVYARVLENYGSGAGASMARGTMWGAYNAITEYVSHQRNREGTAEAQAFADLQWGAGARLANRALAGALELSA